MFIKTHIYYRRMPACGSILRGRAISSPVPAKSYFLRLSGNLCMAATDKPPCRVLKPGWNFIPDLSAKIGSFTITLTPQLDPKSFAQFPSVW